MSAVSTLTVPELKKAGYDRAFIASMIAGSGALAPIIPPSTNMIVYASLTGFSVGKLFMGGIIPGLLIGFALMGRRVPSHKSSANLVRSGTKQPRRNTLSAEDKARRIRFCASL